MVHIEAEQPIPPSAICAASQGLLERQRMHIDTGATHAASFVDRHGTFLYMSEDIGRHNAVDKLVGQLVRNHVDPSSGFVFLSSRCALELVNKVARYGVGVVATVSAPTSAVIEFAREANVTLCAFARGNRFTVYTHPERIAAE
jgi:FdhD protein